MCHRGSGVGLQASRAVTIHHHIVILSPSANSGQVQRRICGQLKQPMLLRPVEGSERDALPSSQHNNLLGNAQGAHDALAKIKDLSRNSMNNLAPRFGSALDGTIEKKPRHSPAMLRFLRLRRVQSWPEDRMRDGHVIS